VNRAAIDLARMGDQNPAGRETVSAAASPKVDLRPSDRPKIRLAELLGALSYALDMTEGQPAGHCVRCCWIGVNIGRQLGLPDADQTTLYYTLLLKDLGCSSNAARICQGLTHDKRSTACVSGCRACDGDGVSSCGRAAV